MATVEKTSAADATYALADGLGSARARTDDSGSVVGTADWDARGNLRTSSGTSGLHGWTGELKDPDTNLVHLRARDYSAGTGRFVQRDTVILNAAGTQVYNGYAYAAENPTTLTDPSVHMAQADVRVVATAGRPITFTMAALATLVIAVILLTLALERYCWDQGQSTTECVGHAAGWGKGQAHGFWSWAATGVEGAVEAIPGVDEAQQIWDRSTVTNRNTRPQDTPTHGPEQGPTIPPIPPDVPKPTPKPEQERCREAGKNWGDTRIVPKL